MRRLDLPFVLGRLLIIAALLAVWEGLPRLGYADPELLPPFTDVLAMLQNLVQRPALREALGVTTLQLLVAVALALPVGVLIGFVLGESEWLARVFDPLVFFLFSIPKSVFLPMFILTMGIGFWQKVAFGVFSTVLIVVMSAATAVRSVKPDHVFTARAFGATRVQIALRVYLPSMLPVLLEGLRLAVIFGFTAVLLAEMYASRDGFGHHIASWGENFQIPQLFAGVLFLAILAIILNEAIRLVEQRCSHWRQ